MNNSCLKTRENRQEKAFAQRKALILSSIQAEKGDPARKDLSKKGSVDTRCLPVMHLLNRAGVVVGTLGNSAPGDYVTTSSCSGRVLLWTGGGKSQGQWTFCSHEVVDLPPSSDFLELFEQKETIDFSTSLCSPALAEFMDGIRLLEKANPSSLTYFKMEPFVMHIQCRDLSAAQKLLLIAMESGYRNSGIVLGKKRIVCCVRECSGFQVPIFQGSNSWVTPTYIYQLLRLGNEAMLKNFERMERFEEKLRNL
mmetsp:Transcript_24761/g.38583  ORF Transcript_24761/g.38583 Transcript_24761/m.38583 type:complete len:253 (-) Transcript_24761:17-775(-)